jgi:hypothetical protein
VFGTGSPTAEITRQRKPKMADRDLVRQQSF